MPAVIDYTPWMPTDGPIMNANGISTAGACEVTEGSGMDIQIAVGEAWISGTFSHTGDPEVITISSNTSGNTRRDTIVIRVEIGTSNAEYAVLEGSTQPTQNSTTWELPLAVVTVVDQAVSISNADIADIRVQYNNSENPVPICTLNYNTNIILPAGATRTMSWNTEIYDPMLSHNLEPLIKVRQTAWYQVKCQFRWEPASSTELPILFNVWGGDNSESRVFNVFNSGSIQTSSGNVDYIFDRNFLLTSSNFIFCTVTNTSTQSVTLKSVGMGLSPQFQLNLSTYPLEVV